MSALNLPCLILSFHSHFDNNTSQSAMEEVEKVTKKRSPYYEEYIFDLVDEAEPHKDTAMAEPRETQRLEAFPRTVPTYSPFAFEFGAESASADLPRASSMISVLRGYNSQLIEKPQASSSASPNTSNTDLSSMSLKHGTKSERLIVPPLSLSFSFWLAHFVSLSLSTSLDPFGTISFRSGTRAQTNTISGSNSRSSRSTL